MIVNDPGPTLHVNGKLSRTIRLTVSPHADFRQVIRILGEIRIPPTQVNDEHVRFAILELLNNSIRAHREKEESRDILIDMTVADGRLVVAIRDFGGGFDPKRLPYDLDADPTTLDLQSPSFEEYQKRNGYKRFGMGIYVAKKTFTDFRLVFLDTQDRPAPWAAGKVPGTLITLTVPTRGQAAAAGGAAAAQGEAAYGN
jgi:anti-sigma regulatory factor (Ser/Thr protein kinase)